jgi:NADPH2:quinone reductase
MAKHQARARDCIHSGEGGPKRAAGVDDVLYSEVDFRSVKRLTGRIGVDVVYDSVGKTLTGAGCRDARAAWFCSAGVGSVPPVDPQTLSTKGSLYLARPFLAHHV